MLGNSLLRALIPGLASLLVAIPENAALWLGRSLGGVYFYFSSRRRSAYADIKAAFGERYTAKDRWRIIKAHYRHLGQMAVEFVRLPIFDKEALNRLVDFPDSERYVHILKDQGMILLTAHLGNWELEQIVSGVLGKPVHVLARSQKEEKLNELLNRFRESHGSRTISRGMGVRGLIRALRRKEVIGVLGDQDAGKHEGIILPFLGRKTTIPTGAFELAARTGTPILPCFITRCGKIKHRIDIGVPTELRTEQIKENGLEEPIRAYIQTLEEYITKFPEQWIWGSKRWKYSWTKRLVILSDGKAGHVKQSEALAEKFKNIHHQYGRPGMEYPTETVAVQFKSEWHRKVFPWFAFFLMPWAQGRLHWLRFFLKPETSEKIEKLGADFVISAGSSLVPLNLLFAKESRGKSIVLMKPSFPFNLFRYDLAVIGVHDNGIIPQEAYRTLLTPSPAGEGELEEDQKDFRNELKHPERIRFAVFLGGSTKRYHLDLGNVEKLVQILEDISKMEGDYVITTSRRTPDTISKFLKAKLAGPSACQSLIIANEDSRPEVVGGMMQAADVLIVTEDSISMISEAVRSGKKVIVLEMAPEGLPSKHNRFKEILHRESAVEVSRLENLKEKIRMIDQKTPSNILEKEEMSLIGRLEQIL